MSKFPLTAAKRVRSSRPSTAVGHVLTLNAVLSRPSPAPRSQLTPRLKNAIIGAATPRYAAVDFRVLLSVAFGAG